MTTQEIFDEFQDEGWNESTQLGLLMQFVDWHKQHILEDFRKHLKERIKTEKMWFSINKNEVNVDKEI